MGEKKKPKKQTYFLLQSVICKIFWNMPYFIKKKKKAKKKSASSDKGFNPDNKEVIGNLPIVWSEV